MDAVLTAPDLPIESTDALDRAGHMSRMKIEDIEEISDFFNTSLLHVSIGDTEILISSYYSEQQQVAIISSIVESVIESFASIGVSMVEKSDVEGEGVQPPPENKTKLKSSDKYDYTEDVIPGKFSDDWEYILHGEDGNFLTRWWETIERDWNAKDNVTAKDIEDLSALAEVIPVIRIGKITVGKELFHRTIKPYILKETKKIVNFEKIVGKNPDIIIENNIIILKGTGPYKGKVFNTGLKADDFFP